MQSGSFIRRFTAAIRFVLSRIALCAVIQVTGRELENPRMQQSDVLQTSSAITETRNRVLRNTYRLLGMSLLVSAGAAFASMRLGVPPLGIFITLAGYFGLLFAIHKFRNRDFSILLVFALTGFMGFTLGPILSLYLQLPGGSGIVTQAFGTTAVAFVALSYFAVVTKKDFSFMGQFLLVGILAAFCAGLASYFFQMPALALVVSTAFVLLMSGLILFETSRIVNGGETNYVLATVTLFVAIFNMFTSLLHIFGVMDE